MQAKRILFATLNWGLGHSTRSIPLIRHFINQGHEIILASDGQAGILLRQEFPDLTYYELPSYNITYSEFSFYRHWARRLPHILNAIYQERREIANLVDALEFDVIVSDNRYGVYDPRIKSIFLTHQLSFYLPPPFSSIISTVIRKMIDKFDQCWIPDFEGEVNLTGLLSKGSLNIEKKYIGLLSRFKIEACNPEYDLGIIISGPEPSRTLFQAQIEELAIELPPNLKMFWVLGKPGSLDIVDSTRSVVFNHLDSKELGYLLNRTEIVISRSGYSSIMDYILLKKKAVLIPTPNQPEQLYLAKRLKDHSQFYICDPNSIDLESGIEKLRSTNEPIQPEIQNHIPLL